MRHHLYFRKKVIVNTDPQRRCYNGCNFSEREEWTELELVCPYRSKEDAESSAATFKQINPGHEYRVEVAP